MNRRRFLASLITGGAVIGTLPALPAFAQIMPEQGVPIPFFRSRADELAREACRQNLPGCRASVRAQLELERQITVIVPWAALGLAILGILFWLRAQEKKKEQVRRAARRQHDPQAYRNLDKTREEREAEELGDDL